MKLYRIMFEANGHDKTGLAKSMTNANRLRVFTEESANREIQKLKEASMSMFGVRIDEKNVDALKIGADFHVEKKELEYVK